MGSTSLLTRPNPAEPLPKEGVYTAQPLELDSLEWFAGVAQDLTSNRLIITIAINSFPLGSIFSSRWKRSMNPLERSGVLYFR